MLKRFRRSAYPYKAIVLNTNEIASIDELDRSVMVRMSNGDTYYLNTTIEELGGKVEDAAVKYEIKKTDAEMERATAVARKKREIGIAKARAKSQEALPREKDYMHNPVNVEF